MALVVLEEELLQELVIEVQMVSSFSVTPYKNTLHIINKVPYEFI